MWHSPQRLGSTGAAGLHGGIILHNQSVFPVTDSIGNWGLLGVVAIQPIPERRAFRAGGIPAKDGAVPQPEARRPEQAAPVFHRVTYAPVAVGSVTGRDPRPDGPRLERQRSGIRGLHLRMSRKAGRDTSKLHLSCQAEL